MIDLKNFSLAFLCVSQTWPYSVILWITRKFAGVFYNVLKQRWLLEMVREPKMFLRGTLQTTQAYDALGKPNPGLLARCVHRAWLS